MKTEVRKEGLFSVTLLSYPLFENLKQNDNAPADKVDNIFINQASGVGVVASFC
mgnify:FL=1